MSFFSNISVPWLVSFNNMTENLGDVVVAVDDAADVVVDVAVVDLVVDGVGDVRPG